MKKQRNPIVFAFACVLMVFSIYKLMNAGNLKELIIAVGLVLMSGGVIVGFFIKKTQNIQLPEHLFRALIIISLVVIIIGVIIR